MVENDYNYLPEQRNWSAFTTLTDAEDNLRFKNAGQIVYIISEDAFYYWHPGSETFEALSTGGGGGGESLADTLTIGNTTGANDILLADFQRLVGETSLWSLDFGDSGYPYMYLTNAAGNQYLYVDDTGFYIQHLNTIILSVLNGSVKPIVAKLGTSATTGTVAGIAHLYLNSFGGATNANVRYSVILGGNNITARTDSTAYANQIGFVNNGAAFEGILKSTSLTANRTYTLPNVSGNVIVQSSAPAYTVTNTSTSRTLDGASGTLLNDLADVVGTLISDLKSIQVLS